MMDAITPIILGLTFLVVGFFVLERANKFPPINIGDWDTDHIAKSAMWFVAGCVLCGCGIVILAVAAVEVLP